MYLIEDNKCKIGDRDIYLEIDNFKKICAECNVDISDGLLETYERYGLLYPLYRITRPKDYLQELFEQSHAPDRNKKAVLVSEEYGNLLKFEFEELLRWYHPIFPEFNRALMEGHPLDQAYSRGESFIQRPSKDAYRNWTEYKIVLETSIKGNPIRKNDMLTRHFYSPWQIYLLEEANRKHIRKINVLMPPSGLEKHIENPPQKTELGGWEDHFKSLWQYRFKENMLLTKSFKDVRGNVLEGNAAEKYHNDWVEIANQTFTHFSYDSWIGFLKALCNLYFNYRKWEKYNLSKCLRKDIRGVIDLLMRGIGKPYGDIIADVGMVLGGTTYLDVPPLERIFPEYGNYLKREAKSFFESVLDDYNSAIPTSSQLTKNAIDEIIGCAFSLGNETLLASVIGINKEYFSPSYFGEEGIWSFLRSLAVATESWVKAMSGEDSFYQAIINMTIGDFDSCCSTIRSACGRTNMDVHNYSDLKQFLDVIPTTPLIRDGRDLSWMRFIIKAYLIRNYAAHHTQLNPELFGSRLIELYNSLLFLVFYAWKKRQP